MKSRRRQVLLFFLCVYSGCNIDVDYRVRADFYYLNDSAFDIVLRRYNAEVGTTMTLLEEIHIGSKAEHLAKLDDMGGEDVGCADFRPVLESDSLSIAYSNGTVTSFGLSDPSSDNPMLLGNYTSKKLAKSYCEFRFTIN